MGEDSGSWPPQQHFNRLIQNQNSFTAPQDLNLGTNMVSTKIKIPVHSVAELPNPWMGQANEPHGWFCLPQFQQAFTPITVSTVKETVPNSPYENSLEAIPPNAGHGCVKKRLLVFDQSGDQTTLIFGSDTRKPVQFPTWIRQFSGVPIPESDINHPLEPIWNSDLNKGRDINEVSEMHEDTEELNALLYSGDESDYTEDDEVTSTGHSPGSITDHGKSEGSFGESASCNKPTRKRKLCDEDHHHNDSESLEDTASSGSYGESASRNKPTRKSKLCDEEDHHNDLESVQDCASSGIPKRSTEYNTPSDDMDSSYENERTRKCKIKETIRVLQRMIPCGKGDDAALVLDEAIQYLTSLRLKAKALGLGAL